MTDKERQPASNTALEDNTVDYKYVQILVIVSFVFETNPFLLPHGEKTSDCFETQLRGSISTASASFSQLVAAEDVSLSLSLSCFSTFGKKGSILSNHCQL